MSPLHDRPTKIGKYEIIATLGRGGMGVVYKARDPMIDRIVAIKTILVGEEAAGDESLLDRLHMEARSAGRLQHPNIVTVYDFGEQDDISYIVMEFVEGINLARLIDEGRSVPLDTKLSILVQIADGLGYAHEHGVVHRDMKPSNVCVTARGTAKILDFGLARFDSTRLTKTGYMAGTIAYMSPERLSGTTGVKDDIFAVGAIAYELLTYQRAFPGTTAPEVMSKIIAPGGPVAPSEIAAVPAELDAIVLKALAKDIDARYDSAWALADDLRRFLRSDILHNYVMDERRPTLDKSISEFVDQRPSAHAYAGPSSTKRFGEPQPTLRVNALNLGSSTEVISREAETAVVPDVNTTGGHTEPDVDLTKASTAPTQIMKAGHPRRAAWSIAAAVVVAIAIAGSVILLRKPAAPVSKPATVVVTKKPQPSATVTASSRDPLAEQSELQLATARNLSEELGRRPLNMREMLRLSQAKAQLSLAERKLNAKDYESGARLTADAIAGLQEVMSTSDQRMQQPSPGRQPPSQSHAPTAVAAPKPRPVESPAPVPTQTIAVAPQPRPAPVEVQQASAPQPRVEPAPAPAVPAESPEKEVTAFMHQLAVAYQGRDIGFFRDHSLRFTDQLANAIRNSPSVKVELHVTRIEVHDAQHASVFVKRTDWFPDSSMPPAAQMLVYHLERGSGGWAIASIGR